MEMPTDDAQAGCRPDGSPAAAFPSRFFLYTAAGLGYAGPSAARSRNKKPPPGLSSRLVFTTSRICTTAAAVIARPLVVHRRFH